MRIIFSSEISSPPELVFTWIAEPHKAMQWQRNVKAAQILDSQPGMVGTTFREEIEEGGRGLEVRGVITRFVEDQIIAFHLESRIHTVDVCYSLQALHAATRVTVEAVIRWRFPFSLLNLFAGERARAGITDQLKAEMADLKRICEAGPPAEGRWARGDG
jgi:hypothetical protein